MSEWWTYRLSNLLMFSPRTYYRLFERYNEDVWPLHLATMLAGGVILVLLIRRKDAGRIVAPLVAVLWLWVAWAFHLQRYRTILPAATWFAALFAVQALLLLWFGRRLTRQGRVSKLAIALFVFAWIVQPMIAGTPWPQWEVFGIAPDPTATATLACLLALEDRPRLILMIIPIMWAVITGMTLWAMHSRAALIAPAVAIATVVARIMRRP